MPHTPGPWHLKRVNGRKRKLLTADGLEVATIVDALPADARLMAGAPKLLKEARRLFKELSSYAGLDQPTSRPEPPRRERLLAAWEALGLVIFEISGELP